MNQWTPQVFVIEGTFATHADLIAATQALAEASSGRAVVASISTRYLVESASYAHGEPGWGAGVINELKGVLQERLRDVEDPIEFVRGALADILGGDGVPTLVRASGGYLERAGRIATLVGCVGDPKNLRISAAAAHAAACALGSRAALSSRDNAISLATINPTRRIAPELESPWRLAPSTRVDHLVRFARQTLGAHSVAVYTVQELHPNAASGVVRQYLDGPDPMPLWIPETVEIPVERLPDLKPVELGSSRFPELGQLVQYCLASRRRLVAIIDGVYWAYGIPYGVDNAPERPPAGVVVMTWNEERDLGLHEMATARTIAVQLARQYEKRRTTDSVTLVTAQLSDISGLNTGGSAKDLTACAPELSDREDVAMVARSVIGIMDGLVRFSGAKSATCRLLAGGGAKPLARNLLRLHCAGDPSRDHSPSDLAIDEFETSANAWVATFGTSVHLRELTYDADTQLTVSPDLAKYPGLRGVQIFRENVGVELCVPIRAENRLVGTVNLEAENTWEFEDTWVVVEEYAQLIGIALLEARRRIGVGSVTEAGGFLDHRHLLDAKVAELQERIVEEPCFDAETRRVYAERVAEIQRIVNMKRLDPVDELEAGSTIGHAMRAAMEAMDWADADVDLIDLLLDIDPSEAKACLEARLEREPAQALTFALAQALHNARRHGLYAPNETGWRHMVVFRMTRQVIGGAPNVYVSVASACDVATASTIEATRVFREPIPAHDDRVSLGTYLAGEELRRCGGSACLRVAFTEGSAVATVEAELSVPIAMIT